MEKNRLILEAKTLDGQWIKFYLDECGAFYPDDNVFYITGDFGNTGCELDSVRVVPPPTPQEQTPDAIVIREQVDNPVDTASDFFVKIASEYDGSPCIESQIFENSNANLQVLKVDDHVKAFCFETRTEFNHVEKVYGRVSHPSPVEAGGETHSIKKFSLLDESIQGVASDSTTPLSQPPSGEIPKGVKLCNCPECGAEIQFGLAKDVIDKFNNSSLFKDKPSGERLTAVLAFEHNGKRWTLHSDGEYYYTGISWPPEATLTLSEAAELYACQSKSICYNAKRLTLEEIEKEAEARYPVKTHSNPSDSPYVSSNKAFVAGAEYASNRQTAGAWVKYPETKPNENKEYLIYVPMGEDSFVTVSPFKTESGRFKYYSNNISHYQELPTPPTT